MSDDDAIVIGSGIGDEQLERTIGSGLIALSDRHVIAQMQPSR